MLGNEIPNTFDFQKFSTQKKMKFCQPVKKLPPSLNARYGWNSHLRKFYPSRELIELRDDVRECFWNSDVSKQILDPWENDVHFEYTICPCRAKTDVDNFAKCCLDVVVECKIIRDCSLVQSVHGYKCQHCRKLKKREKCRWSFVCELTFADSSA